MGKQRPRGDIKIISAREFINDPFTFGALMEFQYGEGTVQEDAERLIFEQLQGINCKPEELDWVLPNYDFLSGKKEKHETRLYYNGDLPSRVALTCLHRAGFDFSSCDTVFTHQQRLPIGVSSSEPVPVLVTKEGGYWAGVEKITAEARQIALNKEVQKLTGQRGTKAWERRMKKMRGTGECWFGAACYDADSRELFKGKHKDAPFPIDTLMKPHGGDQWYQVHCWRIGTIDEVVNDKGEISVPKAETFLFPHDVKKLRKDRTFTSYNCSGFLSGVGIPHRELEAYALDKGTVYRIRSTYID